MLRPIVKSAGSLLFISSYRRISRLNKPTMISIVCALLLIYAISDHFYAHQQLLQYWRTWMRGNTAPAENIWLPDFHVLIEGKVVDAQLTNLSGVTYDYDNDRLLAVTNSGPPQLLTMDREGTILTRYPLIGFEDPEGIAYLGHGRVVLSDENRQQLDIVTLPAQPRPVSVDEAQSIALLINLSQHNKGFEGVTYDPDHDRLFAIKERDPRQVFEVSGMLRALEQGLLQIKIIDHFDWVERSVFSRDLSDGYYDPGTGHLLLLSHQSHSITELDRDGNFVSYRTLLGRISDLHRSAPQPEGITMDRDGNLYVVSEPNLFYKFSRSPGNPGENPSP